VKRHAAAIVVLTAVLASRAPALAAEGSADGQAGSKCLDAGGCPVDLSEDLDGVPDSTGTRAPAGTPDAGRATPPPARAVLTFFWGVGCPHCDEAKPFVAALAREHPDLVVESVEVRRDAAGRERFLRTMQALGAGAAGVPTFVVGSEYVVGFAPGVGEQPIREIVQRALRRERASEGSRSIELPMLGRVDPAAIPLPLFTLMIGLVDGVNPCAMWVLLVLLGILVHVKSRARLLLFGATFVVASGVVYFVFMTAWTHLFKLVGLSRYITIGLGSVVLLMGLINLKEVFWFKKGVSMMIPEKAKPGLYRRMRGIAKSASLPAAFAGIAVLALLVNLIELGCTLGLPAIYTRILTLRTDLSAAAHFGYLALYNVAYVVPLALIVVVYAATFHRLALSERGAKVLKGVSGVLLVTFGLLFVVAPDVLR
jgi:thiol-disulfide isomerase/thioredoxin